MLAVLFAGLAVGVAGAAQHVALEAGRKEARIPRTAFEISNATLVRPLRPGTSQALDLWVSNPHRYSLAITRITVGLAVDYRHVRAGCNRRLDFDLVPIPRRLYPIRVRARRSVSLRRLGVTVLPRVAMVARPHNQNACKGARLTLKLGGSARRWGAGGRR